MTRDITIGGHKIELERLDKPFFPNSGLTKGDIVDYYRRIAPVALPHWRDRPLTMQRFPDGIGEEGFFQKDIPDYFPRWIHRATLSKEDGEVTHVVARDAATLVYLANQGCITAHLGLSRIDRIDRPDRMIFDLDPSSDDFAKVQEAARLLCARLDEVGLACFAQTTGSRGLHVVVPLDRSAGFDEVRRFARDVAARLAEGHPALLTVAQRKAERGDKLYLDTQRNAYGQTAVAPYALRAREGAPVATPLDWSEVGSVKLTAQRYTLSNIFRRLAQKEDPWRDMDDRAKPLGPARERAGKG